MIKFLMLIFIVQSAVGFNIEFDTSIGRNSWNYYWDKFIPNSGEFVNFQVRVKADAYIALLTEPSITDPNIYVAIGGNDNTRSTIRYHGAFLDAEDTPYFLSESEFRSFWIRWNNGVITVGKAGQTTPFLKYINPKPSPILYVGFASAFPGSWIVENHPRWVPHGGVLANPVFAGHDTKSLYVIRAAVEGSVISGIISLGESEGYVIAPNNTEIKVNEYEVLIDLGNALWLDANSSYLPPNAVEGGYSEDGEPIYIGRAPYQGKLKVGKVVPCDGRLYIPSSTGVGVAINQYFVLVQISKLKVRE